MTHADFRRLSETLLHGPSLGRALIDRCPYTAAEVAEMTRAALEGVRWRKTRRMLVPRCRLRVVRRVRAGWVRRSLGRAERSEP